MSRNDEDRRHALVEAAVAHEAADPAEAAFVRRFYQDVPDEDVLARTAAELSDAARALWRFGAERSPGTPNVQIVRRAGARTVAQIITDDMPFLVASVESALSGLGVAVHLIIHPIETVARLGRARVRDGTAGAEHVAEAMMHVELGDDARPDADEAITARLRGVLADVRAVVAAWTPLRQQAQAIADALDTAAGPVPHESATEVAALLRWLEADNFVYLGYRTYRFGADGPAIVPGSGLGVLRDDDFQVFAGLRAITQAAPDVQAFLAGPQLLLVTKSSCPSPVYRAVPMDTLVIKTFDAAGAVDGLVLLLGLFTTTSYFHVPQDIPVVRLKVRRAIARSGFTPASYNRQALQRILDGFPRDDLFHVDSDTLFATAIGILHLRQRPRIGLFVLRDRLERSCTCLVYMPRDRYSADIRRSFTAILERALAGGTVLDGTTFDGPLACLRLVLATTVGQVPEIDVPAIEQQLIEAARTWAERLGEALEAAHGATQAATLLHAYAAAFPPGYVERYGAPAATTDIGFVQRVLDGAPLALALSGGEAGLCLKTFHAGNPVALSDILPMLENLGVRVISEHPFAIQPHDAAPVWIQEFQLQPATTLPPGDADAFARVEDALSQVWAGAVENDGFNRLVLAAGLTARQVVLLRSYCKLLRQAGSSFSQAYMEDTAAAHPAVTQRLVALFEAQFDPERASEAEAAAITADILARLEQVENLDEDRILRGYLLLVGKTLRTNYHQRDAAGAPRPTLALKLASREIDLLPLPRPLVEIFVYSTRMEGCHLRGGRVARGGIRWSDRKEDFRTEILGLMKAQMVKNAVIVPIGSKGGFVLKQPPAGGREALQAEAIACYTMLMDGMLDVTDDYAGDAIVPPAQVVRRDGDDPYLVVAADKGTATFSDIANGIALQRGFWLGDAFASGGSVGYDHKAMGITAKGAWEAVKRHFREIGADIQAADFTCIGVGDMAGDVFGNGMLLSRHTRLLAAFNHLHIFIDPDPDAAASWAERKRLFDLPRSSWADYDPAVLSPGGAVYERRAKAITLSPQARNRFGVTQESLSPQQLIQVLLRQPADLLWFGGIGTYVKASAESHADAGDRANDSLRVDATALRAKVVGEGANLAVTQRARIEYALAGGRINTDAIDNSAGVDTSDHEVNIKIAVADMIAAGHVAAEGRAAFLAAMTQEVGHLVLADNILQTQALTLAEAQAPQALDQHVRLMRGMERTGQLDRAVEFLPGDEALLQREAAARGLTRPEIAVLLAYAKNGLYEQLLATDLPDLPALRPTLLGYFPQAMRGLAPDVLAGHRLRREIVATVVANGIVNRLGPAFVAETQARTGKDVGAIARAWHIVCDVFALEGLWQAVEALDNQVPAAVQTQLLLAVAAAADQALRWFLLSGQELDIAAQTQRFAPGVHHLAAQLADLLPEGERQVHAGQRDAIMAQGAPAALAERVLALAALSTAMDIVQVADAAGHDVAAAARLYFEAGASLGLLTVRRQARRIAVTTEWQRQVVDALLDDSLAQQRALAHRLVAEGVAPGAGLQDWVAQRMPPGSAAQAVLMEVTRAPTPDLAMLTVAAQRLRAVIGA